MLAKKTVCVQLELSALRVKRLLVCARCYDKLTTVRTLATSQALDTDTVEQNGTSKPASWGRRLAAKSLVQPCH